MRQANNTTMAHGQMNKPQYSSWDPSAKWLVQRWLPDPFPGNETHFPQVHDLKGGWKWHFWGMANISSLRPVSGTLKLEQNWGQCLTSFSGWNMICVGAMTQSLPRLLYIVQVVFRDFGTTIYFCRCPIFLLRYWRRISELWAYSVHLWIKFGEWHCFSTVMACLQLSNGNTFNWT